MDNISIGKTDYSVLMDHRVQVEHEQKKVPIEISLRKIKTRFEHLHKDFVTIYNNKPCKEYYDALVLLNSIKTLIV